MNIIEYKIDKDNNIIFVNEEWDRFALSNFGEEIISEKILGKNLLDFIENISVKQIYLDIINQARKGNVITIDFRCDAPTCRRLLQMTIRPEKNNVVTFFSKAKEILSWDYINILDSKAIRSIELIPMCSWCKKIKMDSEWEELEQAIKKYGLLTQKQVPSLTHTICEDCYQKLMYFKNPS